MTIRAVAPRKKSRRRSTNIPSLLGLGTATPTSVPQNQGSALAADLACQTPEQRAFLERIFLRSGICRRGTVLVSDQSAILRDLRAFYPHPVNPSDRGPTTATRLDRYAVAAPALARAAATAALADAALPASAITHLITVSCTGFFAPGLDAALIRELGLAPTVHRLHVGFMGCHAAFNALAAARDAVLANPAAKVLVCCVELCTLHFAYGWDPGKLIANALFADGAAAVVLGRAPARDDANSGALRKNPWRLLDTSSVLIPDSLDAMTWRIGNHGFEMTLAPTVPGLVARHLRPWCEAWLASHQLELRDIAHWAIHPGGPKVLSAVADALTLPPDALRHSRAVLADHGNMSSATVLFILQQMAADPSPAAPGLCVAIGLGPGLMAEALLLAR